MQGKIVCVCYWKLWNPSMCTPSQPPVTLRESNLYGGIILGTWELEADSPKSPGLSGLELELPNCREWGWVGFREKRACRFRTLNESMVDQICLFVFPLGSTLWGCLVLRLHFTAFRSSPMAIPTSVNTSGCFFPISILFILHFLYYSILNSIF